MKLDLDKKVAGYVPDVKFVRELSGQFDSDLQGPHDAKNLYFDEYLCALAYGAIATEIFYDSKIDYKLSAELKKNDDFMQRMITYSILSKIAKAENIRQSSDFEKNLSIDFTKEDEENDYATIAFILHYLNTKGYKVNWKAMCHDYTPINLSNGAVKFSKSITLDEAELLANVENEINNSKTL